METSGGVAPGEWSPTEAVSFGWEKVKADPVGIVLPVFVIGLIQGIPNGGFSTLSNIFTQNDQPLLAGGVNFASWIVQLLISAFMTGGAMTFFFKIVRGQPYQLGDIFSGGKWFANMLITLFVFQVATGLASLLCIVPGIVLALGWSLAVPLVVDRDMAPIDALKESWRITTGHKMSLFVFGLLGFVVCLAGLLACCVGVLPAGAIVAVAQVWIYERLGAGQAAGPPPPAVF